MRDKFHELERHLREVDDLRSTLALMEWDQSTYMPAGGALARARQMATLGRLAHEKLTDPTLGKLLDDLSKDEKTLPYDSYQASLTRVARREFERAIRVPTWFMEERTNLFSTTYQAWRIAKQSGNFATVRPYLEKVLELSRQYANFFGGYKHIGDPLIALEDYGMDVTTIRLLFSSLRAELVPIARAIAVQPKVDDWFLRQTYPEPEQLTFAKLVVRRLGYDFTRGRIDQTPHPFETKFSLGDVRITTRVNLNDPREAIFSSIHEAGHGMYLQGFCSDFEGTPLAYEASAGISESQARLWENIVGRSLEFWEFFYPTLQTLFPQQLDSVSLEAFYRTINRVEPSLIRVLADEVNYNLHIMLRFDLEMALLEGSVEIKDLPNVWGERFHSDIGVSPPNDREGVLQDVHWYSSGIGGRFQGYTLGNIFSAQFFESALREHPEIKNEIRQGRFDTLRDWLQKNVSIHGCKFNAPELVERVTGRPPSIEPYVRYLKSKYSSLYALQ